MHITEALSFLYDFGVTSQFTRDDVCTNVCSIQIECWSPMICDAHSKYEPIHDLSVMYLCGLFVVPVPAFNPTYNCAVWNAHACINIHGYGYMEQNNSQTLSPSLRSR